MRFDEFLSKNGYFDSRTKAKQAIEKGEVILNGEMILKPSKAIDEGEKPDVFVTAAESFVSLGGYKLSKALKDFSFNVQGVTAADIGASTGGFTDCLLQNGAAKVYAVDLNDELLHNSLKKNDKVVRVIKNVKNLSRSDFPDINLITADLSFISAKQVLPVFYRLLPDNGKVILLIKPQFEIGEKRAFKNGIIKDAVLRKKVCREVYDVAIETGFSALAMTTAPIHKEKNTEFLILLSKSGVGNYGFDFLYRF